MRKGRIMASWTPARACLATGPLLAAGGASGDKLRFEGSTLSSSVRERMLSLVGALRFIIKSRHVYETERAQMLRILADRH